MGDSVRDLISKYAELYWKCGNRYMKRSQPPSIWLPNNVLFNESNSYDMFHSINHPMNLTNLIRLKETDREYVDEALIATYPMDKLISQYRKLSRKMVDSLLVELKLDSTMKHPPKNNQERICDWHAVSSDGKMVAFMFPVFRGDNAMDMIRKFVDGLYVCGYNLDSADKIPDSMVFQPFPDDEIELYKLVFEARYSRPEYDFPKFLYHVSPDRYVDKILKRGLVPRSSRDLFNYPDRVYLFRSGDLNELKSYGMTKTQLMKLSSSNLDIDNGFTIFKIDTEKMKEHDLYRRGKMVFYIDSHYEDGGTAIFTYNNIPRDLLENDVLKFNLENN